MVRRQPTLEQLKQSLRANICATCSYRERCAEREGLCRPCEARCSLFVRLPVLQDRAERLDPMIGRHESALLGWMNEFISSDANGPVDGEERLINPLRRYGGQAARLLSRLINC